MTTSTKLTREQASARVMELGPQIAGILGGSWKWVHDPELHHESAGVLRSFENSTLPPYEIQLSINYPYRRIEICGGAQLRDQQGARHTLHDNPRITCATHRTANSIATAILRDVLPGYKIAFERACLAVKTENERWEQVQVAICDLLAVYPHARRYNKDSLDLHKYGRAQVHGTTVDLELRGVSVGQAWAILKLLAEDRNG
jgi:hypothetical protein